MARSRSIRAKLGRLRRLPPRDLGLMLEAVLGLGLSRLALILIPFPRLAPHFGEFLSPSDPKAQAALAEGTGEQARLAGEVARAIHRAVKAAPFEAVCLPQAMTAHAMLRRRGVTSVLHLGAAKGEEKPLESHAWLHAAGVEVTGFPVAYSFTEVACFV